MPASAHLRASVVRHITTTAAKPFKLPRAFPTPLLEFTGWRIFEATLGFSEVGGRPVTTRVRVYFDKAEQRLVIARKVMVSDTGGATKEYRYTILPLSAAEMRALDLSRRQVMALSLPTADTTALSSIFTITQ